jgi:hypothetical protein
MDNEEIKAVAEEAAEKVEAAAETVQETVADAVESAVDTVKEAVEDAPVEIELPEAAEEPAEAVKEAVEEVEGEAVNAFNALKERFNSLKENEIPVVVEELKKRGYVVRDKSKEYAKKLTDTAASSKAKAKAKASEMSKNGRKDDLYYQIGEVAYDGYKNGEDVEAVLQYFFRKMDALNDDAE